MIWLGIETSCDDTSVAIVKDGTQILANLISSQIDIHKLYGGVVPEIASRKHLETINPLMNAALSQAELKWSDIDAVAVSNGPGLIGSLLVGVSAAKAISALLDVPILGINHLPAHIYANFLGESEIQLPAVALLISGGHTCLVNMLAHGHFELLGETRDDAAGECFDKSARILGLPYPGGPEIDRLAQKGNAEKIKFPKAFIHEDNYEFSFSGLKTAVMQYCKKNPDFMIEDVCASLQKAIADVLVAKTLKALKATRNKTLLLAGGVACNSQIRKSLREIAEKHNIDFHMPPPVLCTDNAAMIACLAHYDYQRGVRNDLGVDASPIASW